MLIDTKYQETEMYQTEKFLQQKVNAYGK